MSDPVAICRNCGQPVGGRFCGSCGQEDVADLPLRRLVREFVADLADLDARVWRTLRFLITRPGFLSLEHRAGRRERYTTPTRLYLASSVVLFGMLALSPVRIIHITSASDDPIEARAAADREPDSLSERIELQLGRAAEQPQRLNRLFVRSLAWAMFVLIPLFAALLQLVFRRRGILYVQHLVFALHFHAFGFFTQALAAAATQIRWSMGPIPGAVITMLMPHAVNAVYLFLAARRYYGEGPWRTLGKLAALGAVYPLAIAAVAVATAAVVVLSF